MSNNTEEQSNNINNIDNIDNNYTDVSPEYIKSQNYKSSILFLVASIFVIIISLLLHIIGAGLVHDFRLSEAEVMKEINDNISGDDLPKLRNEENYFNNLISNFSKYSKLDISGVINKLNKNYSLIEKTALKDGEKDFKGIFGSIKGGIVQQERQVSKMIVRLIYNSTKIIDDFTKSNISKKTKENHLNYLHNILTNKAFKNVFNAIIYLIAPLYYLLIKLFSGSLLNIYNTYNILIENEEDPFVLYTTLTGLAAGEIVGANEVVVGSYNIFNMLWNGIKSFFSVFTNIYIVIIFLSILLFSIYWAYFGLLIAGLQNYLFLYSGIIIPSLLGGSLFILFFITIIKLIYDFL